MRFQHCVNRVKKLRETLVAVQQLDKNMSSLRAWLAHIETELSKPIAYDSCDFQEIQRKLDLQQVTMRCIKLNQALESIILIILWPWLCLSLIISYTHSLSLPLRSFSVT